MIRHGAQGNRRGSNFFLSKMKNETTLKGIKGIPWEMGIVTESFKRWKEEEEEKCTMDLSLAHLFWISDVEFKDL